MGAERYSEKSEGGGCRKVGEEWKRMHASELNMFKHVSCFCIYIAFSLY